MSYEEIGSMCSRSRSQQISKCYWLFVQMRSSESQNLLLPNLVWWCIIMRQSVFQKDWVAVFRFVCHLQGQGHSEGSYNQNMTFWYIFWTSYPFATKLGLVAHHHKLDCLVKRLDCFVVIKIKVTGRFKISVNVHLDDISSIAEPFETELDMVMYIITMS